VAWVKGMEKKVIVGIAGFGNVGRALVKKIVNEHDYISKRYGLKIKVKFIADSKGALLGDPWIKHSTLLKSLSTPRGGVSTLPGGIRGTTVTEVLRKVNVNFLVEVTPSNYVNAEPAKTHFMEAIKKRSKIVTANKGPLALYFKELMSLANKYDTAIYYKACVMAGTPLIDLLKYGLAGRRVVKVVGVLNGTTNYILGLLEQGFNLNEALELAQKKGYAEPDPSLDLKGLDLAAKTAIISCTLGKYITINDVEILDTIDENVESKVDRLKVHGERLKYVSYLELREHKVKAQVKLVEVRKNNPLYNVSNVLNGVIIELSDGSKIYLEGPGAGSEVTAATILSDLILASEIRWL